MAQASYISPEVEVNPAGNYWVLFGETYSFNISGIEEYPLGTPITIWAHYKINDDTYNIPVASFTVTATPYNTPPFPWTIPSATEVPYETGIKFKYSTELTGPNPSWYFAKRAALGSPRLLLVIPEVSLGSLGATIALFSGLGITAFFRRKKV